MVYCYTGQILSLRPLRLLGCKKSLRNLYRLDYLQSTSDVWNQKKILQFHGIYIYSAVIRAIQQNMIVGRNSNRAYNTRFAQGGGFSHHYTRLTINESILLHRLVNIKSTCPQFFEVGRNKSLAFCTKNTKAKLLNLCPTELKHCIYG